MNNGRGFTGLRMAAMPGGVVTATTQAIIKLKELILFIYFR